MAALAARQARRRAWPGTPPGPSALMNARPSTSLPSFVRIAAGLIGYGRLAAWPSPSGARAGAYEEAERVARRVEQDAYVILRLEVCHRRPQGKSVLDG